MLTVYSTSVNSTHFNNNDDDDDDNIAKVQLFHLMNINSRSPQEQAKQVGPQVHL